MLHAMADDRSPTPTPLPRSKSPTVRQSLIALSVLMLVSLLMHGWSLGNPFMIDDLDAIVSHPVVRGEAALGDAWLTDYWYGRTFDTQLYRPITIMTWGVIHRAVGPSPWAFRLVNIMLLAFVCWLAWRLTAADTGQRVALAAACLVAAHPVTAELINHVIGLADLLSLGLVLAALLVFRHILGRQRAPWWAWDVLPILAAAAVLTKESGVIVLPTALVAGMCWSRRGGTEMRTRAALIGIALVALGVVAGVGLRMSMVGGPIGYDANIDDLTGNPLRGLGLADRLPGAMAVCGQYLASVLRVTGRFVTVPDHPPTWSAPAVWSGAVMLLASVALLIVLIVQRHHLAMWWALALSTLAMVGNVTMPIGVYVADRLALPFVLAAVVSLAHLAAKLIAKREGPAVATAVGVSALALVCLVLQIRIAGNWSSTTALMKAEHHARPDSPITSYLLGTAYAQDNQHQAAQTLLSQVVRQRPDSTQARLNYAGVLIHLGQLNRAIEQYQHVLAMPPEQTARLIRAQAHGRIGLAHMLQNQDSKALAALRQAIALAPTDPLIMHHYAMATARTGQLKLAANRYRSLLALYPNYTAARRELAQIEKTMETPSLPSPTPTPDDQPMTN